MPNRVPKEWVKLPELWQFRQSGLLEHGSASLFEGVVHGTVERVRREFPVPLVSAV
jgi:hypothetical protein